MKKKLVALALASAFALPLAAQAQTANVTLYGIVDVAFVQANGGGKKFSGIDSGILAGSRLGFTGREDLGNDLATVFTLEYFLVPDENEGIGTAGLKARQTFVGLSSKTLGTVALGRQYAPAFGAAARTDATGGAVYAAAYVLRAFGGNDIQDASVARISSSVTYASPNFSGVTVNAIYGFGENSNRTVSQVNNDFKSIGVNYANGPINVDALASNRRSLAGGTASNREWMIGGSYNFGFVKPFLSYQKKTGSNPIPTPDNKIWDVGVTVPVGTAGTVQVEYSRLSREGGSDADSKGATLGYLHSLSKRTTIYTAYTRIKNDANVPNVASGSGAISVPEGVGAANGSNGTFYLGINHKF